MSIDCVLRSGLSTLVIGLNLVFTSTFEPHWEKVHGEGYLLTLLAQSYAPGNSSPMFVGPQSPQSN